MARSSKVYVLTGWVDWKPFAAFTVKHEMHTFAKRNDLYAKNIRVTELVDGRESTSPREYLLSEPRS